MCGRYSNDKNLDDLAKAFQAAGGHGDDFMDHWKATFSIAPTASAPIVRDRVDDDGTVEREIEGARWGLRPHWLDEKKPGFFNARLETVATKPSFRTAFVTRRILVPMNGYFEWVEMGGVKQPYFIHDPDGGLLSAAGLAEVTKRGDGWLVTYTIITRDSHAAPGEVHDRMPVFLTPDAWGGWLTPDKLDGTAKDTTLEMLNDVSASVADRLVAYPVDRRVNSTRKVDPHDATLLEPITLDE